MSFQYSVAALNAALDAVFTMIGASAVLKIRTGAKPASCAAADSGTVVATMALPATYMAAAANAVKALTGTWQDASADAAGTAAHFRVYDSTGTTCYLQGSVTITGGGGDMTLDNNVLAVGQQVTITAFQISAAAML